MTYRLMTKIIFLYLQPDLTKITPINITAEIGVLKTGWYLAQVYVLQILIQELRIALHGLVEKWIKTRKKKLDVNI